MGHDVHQLSDHPLQEEMKSLATRACEDDTLTYAGTEAQYFLEGIEGIRYFRREDDIKDRLDALRIPENLTAQGKRRAGLSLVTTLASLAKGEQVNFQLATAMVSADIPVPYYKPRIAGQRAALELLCRYSEERGWTTRRAKKLTTRLRNLSALPQDQIRDAASHWYAQIYQDGG